MIDANAFLRRMLVVAAVSALSMVNVGYAHGGKGTGGSSGGGSASGGSSSSSSSAGSGHSSSSTNGGHSVTASSHAVTTSGHTATASKGSRSAHDPATFSQSPNPTLQQVRFVRIFQQPPSTGYTTRYRETNDDWRRKHQRLFLGFIRY